MKSDEQIIEDFQRSGNPADLDELVGRHIGTVHGLAFKMMDNRSAADDITQDVFMKVATALEKFKGESQFSTWLYRIAMNTIYTALKKRSKTETTFEGHDRLLSGVSSPEQEVMQLELKAEIEKEIQALKPEYRAAIVLTAVQGLAPGEAAKVEGCTPQTFYWRLNQARNQLKQRLDRYLKL